MVLLQSSEINSGELTFEACLKKLKSTVIAINSDSGSRINQEISIRRLIEQLLENICLCYFFQLLRYPSAPVERVEINKL